MKKLFSLLTVGLVAFASNGQMIQSPQLESMQTEVSHSAINPQFDYRASGTAIWSEDFGNGFPAGWAVDDQSGICPWVWSLDGSWGNFSVGGTTAGGDPIASTTGANGFLIVDPDSANHFNFGQPSGTTYQYLDSYFITDAIDLSGQPNVRLEFEQAFRFNNSPDLEVMVSNDSVNWTTWTVQGNTVANSASPNPELIGINISGVAGNQPTVYLKFGWSARVYFWMIDDIRIVEAPGNDLKITSVNYDEWFFDQAADFSTLEYSIYPGTQTRPLNLKANIVNDGTINQTNVTLTADVTDATATSVFNGTDVLASVMPFASDSLSVTGYTPGSTVGRYTIDYTLTSDTTDATPDNNVEQKWFEVSDYIFARDTGALDGNINNNQTIGGPYETGNWFNIQNQDEMLYGIDVAIDDATDVGTLIYGALRDGNRDLIVETAEYTIQASDLNAAGGGNYVTLLFPFPETVLNGEDYLVMVGHYGGSSDIVIGTSGNSVPQTSLFYDGDTDTYFFTTSTPMVRMNFDPTVGINDAEAMNGLSLGQNFPNPANGNTMIRFNLENAMNLTFEVRDLSGKLVHTDNLGSTSPGVHTIDFNTSNLSDGVYHYSLISNEVKLTERMTVMNK
jgi:hypothetical protein